MTPQRKKGPVEQKRFVILFEHNGIFDQTLEKLIRREAPDIIFQTLATLEVKSKSALAEALGITRERLAGLLVDLGITTIFEEIRKHGRKKASTAKQGHPAKK